MTEVHVELAGGITIAWNLESVRGIAEDPDGLEWSRSGEVHPGHTALRVLSAATAEGEVLLLAAARPNGADGHDAEAPVAVRISKDGSLTEIDEALLSTEYARDGSVRRLGLELYEAGDDFPVRAAGDVSRTDASDEEGMRRERAVAEFRIAGATGIAVYEILHV